MSAYAHPHVLVSTQWVADHLNDPHVRVLEVGWDTSEYASGHIPGAIGLGFADLHQPNSLDILTKPQIESLLSNAGVANTNTVVLYGGLNNIVAALAFWTLKFYEYVDVRLLDGGRQNWIADGRELTTETPIVQPTAYVAQEPNGNLRADHELIIKAIGQPGYTLVDARSVAMYIGEDTSDAERGGHIPTAVNVPANFIVDDEGNFQGWQTPTTREDGTFKPVEELRSLVSEYGISQDNTVITYCVRGGLSSHLWFVLTQLLGYPNVREYDRSWIEWGNLRDAPVER